jgi:hypothetical protein
MQAQCLGCAHNRHKRGLLMVSEKAKGHYMRQRKCNNRSSDGYCSAFTLCNPSAPALGCSCLATAKAHGIC